jgi:hypothetical protein
MVAVNLAARVQALSDANEIYLTDEILSIPGAEELVAGFATAARSVQLRGVQGNVRVHRVLPRARLCTNIVDLHASVETPYVSSNDALRTEEFSLLEPDVLDNKYYVRDIGLVREQTIQGGSDVLELVSVTRP